MKIILKAFCFMFALNLATCKPVVDDSATKHYDDIINTNPLTYDDEEYTGVFLTPSFGDEQQTDDFSGDDVTEPLSSGYDVTKEHSTGKQANVKFFVDEETNITYFNDYDAFKEFTYYGTDADQLKNMTFWDESKQRMVPGSEYFTKEDLEYFENGGYSDDYLENLRKEDKAWLEEQVEEQRRVEEMERLAEEREERERIAEEKYWAEYYAEQERIADEEERKFQEELKGYGGYWYYPDE